MSSQLDENNSPQNNYPSQTHARRLNTPEAQANYELNRRLDERDRDNVSRGVLIGFIAAALGGVALLTWFFLSQQDGPDVAPVSVPVPVESQEDASPEPPAQPDINVTIQEPPTETPPSTDVNTEVTVPSQPSPSEDSTTSETTTPAPAENNAEASQSVSPPQESRQPNTAEPSTPSPDVSSSSSPESQTATPPQ